MSKIEAKIDDIRLDLLWAENHLILVTPKGEHEQWLRVVSEVHDLDLKKPITLTIEQPKRRRSQDANAYYWQLVGKMAGYLKISNAEMHNTLLARYGEPMTDTEGKVVYVLLKDSIPYLQDDAVHLRPTSGVEMRKGVPYRWYTMMRGSSDYDTAEMSRLIDGAVSEAREMGIETLTPREFVGLSGYVDNHVENNVEK